MSKKQKKEINECQNEVDLSRDKICETGQNKRSQRRLRSGSLMVPHAGAEDMSLTNALSKDDIHKDVESESKRGKRKGVHASEKINTQKKIKSSMNQDKESILKTSPVGRVLRNQKPVPIESPASKRNVKERQVKEFEEDERNLSLLIRSKDTGVVPKVSFHTKYIEQLDTSSPINFLPNVCVERCPQEVIDEFTDSSGDSVMNPPGCRFGFIGLDDFGLQLVNNLLSTGHKVTLSDPHSFESYELFDEGATLETNHAVLCEKSDIIFCCLPNSAAVEKLLEDVSVINMLSNKGFVNLTTMNAMEASNIAQVMESSGCRHLEVKATSLKKAGTKKRFEVFVGGNSSLLEEIMPCLSSCSHSVNDYGSVEKACNLGLVANIFLGTLTTSYVECLSVLKNCDISVETILKISNAACFTGTTVTSSLYGMMTDGQDKAFPGKVAFDCLKSLRGQIGNLSRSKMLGTFSELMKKKRKEKSD